MSIPDLEFSWYNTGMIREAPVHEIQRRFKTSPVVALLGPRQCGKTTVARQFASRAGAVHFFDLEEPEHLRRLDQPKLALEPLRGLVVIDEVQRRPELFPVLRVLADRPKSPARFLILGSASRELIRQSSETLAGRIAYLELTPFLLSEIGPQKGPEKRAEKKHWLRGGFPRSYLARSDEQSLVWRKDYIGTFLERDIPALGIRIPSASLRKFWMMLAHYHGQLWNASEIGKSLGLGDTTVKGYLDTLVGTFMVRALQPWHENIKKRQVKTPKIFFRDSGIYHAILGIQKQADLQTNPKLGASWEGYALENIIHSLAIDKAEVFFWGTHGNAELDLLTFQSGKRIGYEIKYSDAPKITPSMVIALRDLGLKEVNVIYPGASNYKLKPNINVLSIREFMGRI